MLTPVKAWRADFGLSFRLKAPSATPGRIKGEWQEQAMRDLDLELMHRCIALGASSVKEGEYPFAAVIASNGSFVCESINRVKRDRDVNRHAEVIAISRAQLVRGTNLSDCTIYSTVEPCAQCSYAIREARIGRVVYGLRSPLMGGHSRWNILSDPNLSSPVPRVESADLARNQSKKNIRRQIRWKRRCSIAFRGRLRDRPDTVAQNAADQPNAADMS